MNINEQVKELRELADDMEKYVGLRPKPHILREAADTIESLSAKLQAANMERNEILEEIREKAQELSNQHWGDDERHLIGKGIQYMCVQAEKIIKANMEQSAEDCGGWILCSERMPEENKEVICCFESGIVKALVLFNCKFHGKVYAYEKSDIIAWQPLPEPYHEP